MLEEFKKDGFTDEEILINFLPDICEDICEEFNLVEHGIPISSLSKPRSSDIIDGKKQLLEAFDTKFGEIAILESGDVYAIITKIEKTGEETINGDDECFSDFKVRIHLAHHIGTIQNLKNKTELTEEQLEKIGFEIIIKLYANSKDENLICQ